ncbi:MAG TPA: tetratricopeptide repeat protein [Longimicrobium sp.]|nr:tetratricopeptide repeat protein [Longimicrobium sp.]
MKPASALVLACLLLLPACVRRPGGPAPGRPEAVSLLGAPLYPPELPHEARQRLEAQLDTARRAYERNPDDADALIWYGRRTAYLGRYHDAIGIFTEGIRRHPRDPRMYRHRGHRWITVRRFGRAASDLQRAARLARGRPDEPEPDGVPSARGVPRSTLQGNIWYHLGLAYYLQGDFARAAWAFRECLGLAQNDDSRVAAADWLYMSLRRLGREAEAAAVLDVVRPGMDVVENASYLRRLRMYRGELPPDSLLDPAGKDALEVATQGYAVGNWHLYHGRRDEAEEVFWRVTAAENWAPFGYIAAEAELRRTLRRKGFRPPR